jgi:hypothetical protein
MAMSKSSFIGAATTALLIAFAGAASTASAQMHVRAEGDYVLRASTVSAANLPRAMRTEHNIPEGPNTGVLNVVVQHQTDGTLRNVQARVEVRARNLLGAETNVDVREVVADGFVSYLGTYFFLPREIIDFRVTAHPEGGDQPITLEFRDRLGRR